MTGTVCGARDTNGRSVVSVPVHCDFNCDVFAVDVCAGDGSRFAHSRNEITALWAQIRDWRREGGMDVEPDDSQVMAMKRMSVSSAARACALPAAPRRACGDVCDLGDAICDNAESICGIADELGNDAWAREKCDSAKASCREAQERCCRCDRNPPQEPTSP